MNNRLLMGLLINGRGQLPKHKQRSTINRTIMGDFLGVGSTMAEDLCRRCGANPYASSADWAQMKPDAEEYALGVPEVGFGNMRQVTEGQDKASTIAVQSK